MKFKILYFFKRLSILSLFFVLSSHLLSKEVTLVDFVFDKEMEKQQFTGIYSMASVYNLLDYKSSKESFLLKKYDYVLGYSNVNRIGEDVNYQYQVELLNLKNSTYYKSEDYSMSSTRDDFEIRVFYLNNIFSSSLSIYQNDVGLSFRLTPKLYRDFYLDLGIIDRRLFATDIFLEDFYTIPITLSDNTISLGLDYITGLISIGADFNLKRYNLKTNNNNSNYSEIYLGTDVDINSEYSVTSEIQYNFEESNIYLLTNFEEYVVSGYMSTSNSDFLVINSKKNIFYKLNGGFKNKIFSVDIGHSSLSGDSLNGFFSATPVFPAAFLTGDHYKFTGQLLEIKSFSFSTMFSQKIKSHTLIYNLGLNNYNWKSKVAYKTRDWVIYPIYFNYVEEKEYELLSYNDQLIKLGLDLELNIDKFIIKPSIVQYLSVDLLQEFYEDKRGTNSEGSTVNTMDNEVDKIDGGRFLGIELFYKL